MHPFIGCLVPFYKNRHRLLDWYTDLLAASPAQTVVLERLGARRTVVTAHPDNVEYMLKTNFTNYPKGKPFTDILGDLLGSGIFNTDGELWRTQRKLASHEFTTKSLREFFVKALEMETNDRLLLILSTACADRRTVDVQDLLRRFAFDTICKVTLGTDPGFLDPSLPTSEFADAFDVASGISARRGAALVSATWKLKRAFGVGSERRLRASIQLIHGSVMSLIRRRKEEGVERGDLLSRLISGGHSEEVIRDMVISFMMAGRDTTSAALTWFFWLMSRHPDMEKEVVEEVVNRAKGRRLEYQELKEMKFLEACLCESMRLYPPVAWDSKHAAGADVLPDGTKVRRGDRVTYFPYGMGRMERLWGKDWMEFEPRRWLAAEGKEVAKVSAYKFAVFQAGPRVCLGKEMAFIQMKYIAAAVLRRFELRRAGGEKRPPVLVPLLTAHMAGGLKMAVRERRELDSIGSMDGGGCDKD